MAKIHGKENDVMEITIDNITEEQIVAMAKYIQLLQEENQNLKGFITQLQAQLQAARQNRATAEYRLQQHQNSVINITSTLEDEFNKKD